MNFRVHLFFLITLTIIPLSCASGTRPRPAEIKHETTGDMSLEFIGSIPNTGAVTSPGGITAGFDGSLYVCDHDNARIVRIDTNGRLLAQFEGFDSRTDPLFLPIDISVSGGIEVYVLDSAGSRVFRLDRNLKNAYAVYRSDSDEERRFGTFGGIAFDTRSGDLFISDRDNGAMIRIDMLGGNVQTTGGFGTGRQSLKKPAGLDMASDGSLVIADPGKGALAVLPHFGEAITFIGGDVLEAPTDVAEISPGTYAASDRHGIVIIDRHGTVHATAGFDESNVMSPRSVAFFNEILYVSDGETSSILMYRLSAASAK